MNAQQNLPKIDDISFLYTFSTREDGNVSFKSGDTKANKKNRIEFFKHRGIKREDIHFIHLNHSPNLAHIERKGDKEIRTVFRFQPKIKADYSEYLTGYDGAFTRDETTILAMTTADCIPLLFWEKESKIRGILHIGLLGVLNNSVNNLASALDKEGVAVSELNFYIGPGIGQEHYNLSKSGLWRDIKSQSQAKEQRKILDKHIKKQEQGEFINLSGAIKEQLNIVGVDDKAIQEYALSTADPKSPFFSHYTVVHNGGADGSFLSLIGPPVAT